MMHLAEGFTQCEAGHTHWGMAGAAGLLILSKDGDGEAVALLQHRSIEVHEGGCWGIPGGARDYSETAFLAALRESEEELELELPHLEVLREVVNDHGGWSYTTVVAASVEPFTLPETYGWETGPEGFRWVRVAELASLDLHSGLSLVLGECV